MIKSMTGYGRAVETVNGREFTVELRSVNNRYLDCSVRLPRIVSFAEDAVKQAVKASISRGKVDVFIAAYLWGMRWSLGGLTGSIAFGLSVVLIVLYDRLVMKKRNTVYTIIGYGPKGAQA